MLEAGKAGPKVERQRQHQGAAVGSEKEPAVVGVLRNIWRRRQGAGEMDIV